MSELTHIDETGAARMVDVGDKAVTERVAVASAVVVMLPETLALLEQGGHKKGDVLAVARIAGSGSLKAQNGSAKKPTAPSWGFSAATCSS